MTGEKEWSVPPAGESGTPGGAIAQAEGAAKTGWMKELSNATINGEEWSVTPTTGGGLPNTANNEKDYSTLDLIWTPPTKRTLKGWRKWVAALEAIEASAGPWYI